MEVADLFGGIGGWDLAARELGVDPTGYELDTLACETRDYAQLRTHCVDLTEFEPRPCVGLIASPPCQSFSLAGKRNGLTDARGQLVFVPLRWIEACNPEWVVMEQVPPVLPIWKEYAAHLEERGYSAWAGVLSAEQYGVPQTRRRAILIASRTRVVAPPKPTHSAYYSRDPQRLDPDVAPWISMADALGWEEGRVGFPRRNDRDTEDEYRESLFRDIHLPAFNLTEKARSWMYERPAPTLVTSRRSDQGIVVGRALTPGAERDPRHGGWTLARSRPAPTVSGGGTASGGAEPFANRALRDAIGVRITLAEALILQGFPCDYYIAGVKTRQFLQVGNAIPPPLARAILGTVLT